MGVPSRAVGGLPKAATGTPGLDHVTQGGFPAERPTLVCGGPGSGKTMLAPEFLVKPDATFLSRSARRRLGD